MKKLHAFVIKAFLGPFLLNLVIADFLFLMIWIWKYVDDLIGRGLEFTVLLELIGYAAILQLPLCLPLAMLLSSIMTFGNLGESSELTAMKSLGISLQRTIFPLFVLAIGISMFAFVSSNNLLPYANLEIKTLLNDIMRKSPELNIPEGQFYNGIENYTIRVNKKYKDQTLKGVRLYDHTTTTTSAFIVADSGRMESIYDGRYLKLTLYDGAAYQDDSEKQQNKKNNTYPFIRNDFKENVIYFNLDFTNFTPTDGNAYKSNSRMLNIIQLENAIDSLKLKVTERREQLAYDLNNHFYFRQDSTLKLDTVRANALDSSEIITLVSEGSRESILKQAAESIRTAKGYPNRSNTFEEGKERVMNRHAIEWHKKFTLAVACLILFFIGAPFGAIVRKGGLGWPVVIAVILFLVYYIITSIGERLAKEQEMDAALGIWMASLVLAPIGAFLTYKATRESSMFSKHIYVTFFDKLLKLFKKKTKSV